MKSRPLRATAAILDAISDGLYSEQWLYEDKETFELNFNRPWHGLDPAQTEAEINNLQDKKIVIRHRVEQKSLAPLRFIGLTPKGGDLWEDFFDVRWEKYCQYYEIITQEGRGVSFVNFISRKVAESFCMRDYFIGTKNELRAAHGWEWSNWKTHKQYYIVGVEEQHREFAMETVTLLRRGWKNGMT